MSVSGSHSARIGKFLSIVFGAVAVASIVLALIYAQMFGPIETAAPTKEFLVQENETVDQVAEALAKEGYVRGAWIFRLAYLRESYGKTIRPGGYEISKSMDAWSVANTLVQPPYIAWVKIPVGVRKEQVANIVATALGWASATKQQWLSITDSMGKDYVEGIYFPDTYFIPTDSTPSQVAALMKARFQEAFAPYADEAIKKKISWPAVLTIASIIQREAGSVDDMAIISGVIQKRLAVGMPLAMDATLQYMVGNEDAGWWTPPRSASTYPDAPFNSYKRKGLPPHPIANPGLAAIDAALNPKATDCLFYLHDTKGKIHCSATYKGQLANVQKYLK